jgi:hypothetical protein
MSPLPAPLAEKVDLLMADNDRLRTALGAMSSGRPPAEPLEQLLQPPPDLPAEATDVINKIRLTDDKARGAGF